VKSKETVSSNIAMCPGSIFITSPALRLYFDRVSVQLAKTTPGPVNF